MVLPQHAVDQQHGLEDDEDGDVDQIQVELETGEQHGVLGEEEQHDVGEEDEQSDETVQVDEAEERGKEHQAAQVDCAFQCPVVDQCASHCLIAHYLQVVRRFG